MDDLITTLPVLLRQADGLLEQLLAGLSAEKDSPRRNNLEHAQNAAFTITRLHARLYAAKIMIEYARIGDVEARLTLMFAGLTLTELREKGASLALQIENGQAHGALDNHPRENQAGGGVQRAFEDFFNDKDAIALIRLVATEDFAADMLERMEETNTDGADGLPEEYRLLRETFNTFAQRSVRPLAESWHREDRLIPDDLIAQAAELGCFGLSIPAQYGGAADTPDNLGMVVVTEELSRGALIFGSLITRPEILAKALLKGGTEAQKARFLPPMASGKNMVAVSITEPDFGSDVAGLKALATPVEGGWRLNGAKMWCTFAGRAELLGILVRTEPDPKLGHRGLSMFIIEKPKFTGHDFEYAPPGGGLLRGRAISTLGYRGMHSFELTFEDFFIPAENLVGEDAGRGKGFYLQMDAFAFGRLQTAGRALGVMQAAWESAWAYSRARRVFGQPLAAFSITRHKLAAMAATVQACRQATLAAARGLGHGEGQMEASLVKLLACNAAEWVTREAQQLHGGMGYAEEVAVSRWFVDARVLSIFEGTEEVLALRVILPALLKRLDGL